MFILLITLSLLSTIDYATIFGKKYDEAYQYMQDNYKDFNHRAKHHNIDAEELLSIAFPHLLKEVEQLDFAQAKALEMAYIKDQDDSEKLELGDFWLSLSFLQKVENALQKDPLLQKEFPAILHYRTKLPSKIRIMQIQRLKNKHWQFKYISCFYMLCSKTFATDIQDYDKKQRINFISTAFHLVCLDDFDKIKKGMLKKSFTPLNKEDTYCFANIAWDFYTRLQE